MLIYIFAEHYPNPYKPQFDTEFAFFIRQGHEIRIYAAGQYISTVHPRVRAYHLDEKTFLFPTTLKTLPHFFWPCLCQLVRAPRVSLSRLRAIYDSQLSIKKNVMRFFRMLVLPEASPDLCYIHNIATANMIDFLPQIYPMSRMAMYFHGGEVGGVQRVLRDAQLFAQMQVVFSNTNFSRNQAVERGCPADRAIALPVGFDISDYPANALKAYRRDGVLRLVSVGRLSEEKGLVYVLDALSVLIGDEGLDIRYTIVGRGMQEACLRDYVQAKGLDRLVDFVGERDKAGVVEILGQSDVLVLPSIVTDTWAETQAAVVQEAMFMRLLVIASQAGGVPESTAPILRPLSVPVANAEAIAEKIRFILSLPLAEIARMGAEARQFTLERFDIDRTGAQLIAYAMGNESFRGVSTPLSEIRLGHKDLDGAVRPVI